MILLEPRKPGDDKQGRAAGINPANRFEPLEVETEADVAAEREIKTEYYRDQAASALTSNESPDVPFSYSINPYRGCEHGCIYCYARPTHEYYGLSPGLDFESKIFVKTNLPDRLREDLRDPDWSPQVVALSGNTDPYQPAEDHFGLSSKLLGVFKRYRNPVSIITKNARILGDQDLLAQMAEKNLVEVTLSITTLRNDLARSMEPRTSRPGRRLEAVRQLSEAGVPVGVNLAPVIPGLTDEEIPSILEAASEAGARRASYILVRLPHAVKDLFDDWLRREYPERKNKVLSQIRSTRNGQLNETNFGDRMSGDGTMARLIEQLFKQSVKKYNLDNPKTNLTTDDFQPPGGQRDLFTDR